jgi:hypothetical protein
MPGERSTSSDFLTAVATKTNEPSSREIFALISTILSGHWQTTPRVSACSEKQNGRARNEPGRCEFVLADF